MERSMGVFIDSDMNSHRNYQNNQSNSGLLRFRSAPSSLLENFTNGLEKGLDSCQNFSNPNSISQTFEDLEGNKSMGNGFSANSLLPPHYPRQSSATQLTAMDGSYRAVSSIVMDHHRQVKSGSHLMRQSSSPAGLFSHLTSQNDIAGYNTALKSQMSYSSGVPSSLGMLSQISEIDSENVEESGHEDIKLGNGNGSEAHFYSPRYPFSSWNDSSNFAENFSGLKRDLDGDVKLFAGTQDGELGNRTHALSHHLSLPKTSVEMAAMEKLLQFQDSVPCKIRAKRGCATHPRSIAERVRRTRISERMRKLQELVPNMDKMMDFYIEMLYKLLTDQFKFMQTNTADMLDLAVDYIKDLQKQFKTLSDNRSNCTCSNQRV